MKLCLVMFLITLGTVLGEDVYVQRLESVVNFMKNCESDLSLCLKEKLLNVVNKMRQSKKITLINGLDLVGDKSRDGRMYEALPGDLQQREIEVESRLVDGAMELMETHRLEVSLKENKAESRALEEARKKKKDGGGSMLLPLLFIFGLKKKLLLLSLLAAKAAVVFKTAILIAAFVIFYDWGAKSTSYQVVAHPQHSHKVHNHVAHEHIHAHDDDYAGGHEHASYGGHDEWGKSGAEDAHSQAYSGYSAGYHRRK